MAPIGAILYEWRHGVTSWVTPLQSLTPSLSWFGLVLLGFNASATARVISRRWNDDEISFLVEETGVPGGNHRPENKPDSSLFHGRPSCASLLERILSQNGKTKARLLLHTLFFMYQFHQAKLSVMAWHELVGQCYLELPTKVNLQETLIFKVHVLFNSYIMQISWNVHN